MYEQERRVPAAAFSAAHAASGATSLRSPPERAWSPAPVEDALADRLRGALAGRRATLQRKIGVISAANRATAQIVRHFDDRVFRIKDVKLGRAFGSAAPPVMAYVLEATAAPAEEVDVKPSDPGYGLVGDAASVNAYFAGAAPGKVFPDAMGGTDKNDWRYWFNYFYFELSPSDRRTYWLNARQGRLYDNWDQNNANDAALINTLLTTMMLRGMVSYADVEAGVGAAHAQRYASQFSAGAAGLAGLTAGVAGISQAGDALTAGGTLSVPGLAARHMGLAFRGDSRDYKSISASGGFKPKVDARVRGVRTFTAYDQPWHPFAGTNALTVPRLFRIVQNDAELDTVVAVAPNFGDSTKFPLLHEMQAKQRASARAKGSGARPRHPLIEDVPDPWVTPTQVYLVMVSQGLDTAAVQRALFGAESVYGQGEKAVLEVPADEILAVMDIERWHFGEHADQGHAAVMRSWRWTSTNPIEVLGVEPMEDLRSALDTLKRDSQAGRVAYMSSAAALRVRPDISGIYKERLREDVFEANKQRFAAAGK